MKIDINSATITLNLNAKEVSKITQILQDKSSMKIINEFLNKFLIGTIDNDVFHVHQDDCNLSL